MITTVGARHIKRYLAGFVPAIAQSIAFGLATDSESASDTKLVFEVGRVDVSLVSYDFANNRLIFKGPVDEDFSGIINEVAIFSTLANRAAGEFGSKILTTFDSGTETWVDSTAETAASFLSTNARIGADSLRQQPGAGTTKSDKLSDIVLDLSGYSSADTFNLAFYSANTSATDISVLFMTDASNYYTVSFGGAATGYQTVEVTKGAATTTGTPNWENITEIRVETTATGSAADTQIDGLRIEDNDTVNADYVMVAREVLSSSFTKEEGKTQDIEFRLDINVSS